MTNYRGMPGSTPSYTATRSDTASSSGSSSPRGAACSRVAIVDDHPAIRKAISREAEDRLDVEIVAETGSAEEARRRVPERRPDVAIVDLSLGGEQGLERGFGLIKTLRAECPDAAVLVFSMHQESVYAERAVRAGASGYLMKGASATEVLEAARRVADGKMCLSPYMTARVVRKASSGEETATFFPIDELSDRELEVFRMLGQGLSTEAIADRLGITRKTIETHRRTAKDKLGYQNVTDLRCHAIQWVQAERTESE